MKHLDIRSHTEYCIVCSNQLALAQKKGPHAHLRDEERTSQEDRSLTQGHTDRWEDTGLVGSLGKRVPTPAFTDS